MNNKGQGFVGALIGIMMAVIIGVGVTLPVAMNVLSSTNFTGFSLTQTISLFIPVLIAATLIVAIASVMSKK